MGYAAATHPDVSIHAPVKGRPFQLGQQDSYRRFNPRPREGATYRQRRTAELALVSIHAPVKGRLRLTKPTGNAVAVSIHAPVKGRRSRLARAGMVVQVSIHAPVKGRLIHGAQVPLFVKFQSTPP